MPGHRIDSGPDEPDLGVLEQAVARLEAAGEEVVQVLDAFLAYPTGAWVIVTRSRGVEYR